MIFAWLPSQVALIHERIITTYGNFNMDLHSDYSND